MQIPWCTPPLITCAFFFLSGMATILLCANRFHDRTFDVGIAEQHAVTFAAGLACEGLRPFCAIYSTFLQRGYDQIIHDVALQDLPGKGYSCSYTEHFTS